jgi:WD40 repeat protein/tRNA A-37 threonylcarbamoyl transferase component Bud32
MSYCLNPYCASPKNLESAKFCTSCGFQLLLGDRYQALTPIGQGGFGRTFLAADHYKPSQPKCVIKQFFPQRQSVSDLARARELFRREAVQLEQLGNHPQIPELLAHFEQADYQYLVQEYIRGQNLLQEVAQSGAFSDRQVWQLLADLLPVLDYVHQHQVIHRDIKPQNIIRRANSQQYVLVDFGAAKSVGYSDLARTGTSIGSPEFIPPEQVIGKATYASDLYSLGVTCLYLLTGMRPANLYDTEEGVWSWRPQLPQPLPTALSNILDRLLQGAVKRRYPSAIAVLRDLHDPILLAALQVETVAQLDSPAISKAESAASQPLLTTMSAAESGTTQLPPSQLAERWICTHTLSGHRNWVRSLVIHPDGKTLASGSGDKTLRIWNLLTGETLREIPAHDSWVRTVALSPDGKILASGSNDRTIKLWDWQTGDQLHSLTGHTEWVRAIAFSPDGKMLFSSAQDKTIRCWQMPTGTAKAILTGHTHWVVCLISTAIAGRLWLFSGSRDHTIRVWDGRTGESLHTLTGHTATVNALTLSLDRTTLISGSDDGTIRLWNWQRGRCLHTLPGDGNPVHALAVSGDGNWLVSGGQDKALKLWELSSRLLKHTLSGHLGWIWTVAFSPDQKTLASGSWDGTVKLWCKQDKQE